MKKKDLVKQGKFRSKVLWAAVAAQVVSILLLTGVVDATQSETINNVIGGTLQILVLLGILNNPNDKANL